MNICVSQPISLIVRGLVPPLSYGYWNGMVHYLMSCLLRVTTILGISHDGLCAPMKIIILLNLQTFLLVAIREIRGIIDGPMVVIRFGSSGTHNKEVEAGDVVIADETIRVDQNPDVFIDADPLAFSVEERYRASKPVRPNAELSDIVCVQEGSSQISYLLDTSLQNI